MSIIYNDTGARQNSLGCFINAFEWCFKYITFSLHNMKTWGFYIRQLEINLHDLKVQIVIYTNLQYNANEENEFRTNYIKVQYLLIATVL